MVLLSIGVLVLSTHTIGQISLERNQWSEYLGEDFDEYDWFYDFLYDWDSENSTYTYIYDYYENDTMDISEKYYHLEQKYPDVFAVKPILLILGYITAVFFAIELCLRFITCPNKCNFFLSFFNIIDILAVLFAAIFTLIGNILPALKYQETWLHILYFTKILRILRLFRVLRHSVVFQVLVHAVLSSLNELLMILVFFCIFTLIFSSLAFFAMERSFKSIPDAIWWAVVTMTTVGYGDMYPKTVQGRIIGTICAITGICLLAILIPVFVNSFLLLKSHVSQFNPKIGRSRARKKSTSSTRKTKVHPKGIVPIRTIY